jgi:NAD+ synthase (glutamine-hydrolysing)
MKYGFVKVAAATPKIEVANCRYNRDRIIEYIDEANKKNVKVLVFPELCLTGYTCGDLFLQDVLIKRGKEELIKISHYTQGMDMLVVVGLPFDKDGKLYNVGGVIQDGKIIGFVPKKNIPNYSEFYEGRHFVSFEEETTVITIDGYEVPFGTNLLFRCENMKQLTIGIEICEDLWVPSPPSSNHAMAGATLILNPSASNESIGKSEYRRNLIKIQSARLLCGYVYADAGEGESTTDLVFAGHNVIAENGSILEESPLFQNNLTISEIDFEKIMNERRRLSTFTPATGKEYKVIEFKLASHDKLQETSINRKISPNPFIPSNKENRNNRLKDIINMQAYGLKKRLEHTKSKNVVLGLSGGLDSTLALLVTKKAFDYLELDSSGIICVTMPCFGTTDRTYHNALDLAKELGATLREIPIEDAVLQHFRDIGHNGKDHDVTYENAQARERTQVLMDISNQCNGMVIGTGDMSELALGWATYNGDHMSMYGVNASIPKTLVRYLVEYFAGNTHNSGLKKVLNDILMTPVSPELLPPVDGVISQKTEDIVGPYELHDFFLYYILRYGFLPSKVYYLATLAFKDRYSNKIIYKWLSVFYRRFFSQQFKRSCLPDGPKVGSVAISPRGDLRMPSDASVEIWLEDLERCQAPEGY